MLLIDPAAEDACAVGDTMVCDQRIFVGHLLRAAANAAPKAIVIDKHYSKASCLQRGQQLQTAFFLQQLAKIAQKIPVIYGLSMKGETRLPSTINDLAQSVSAAGNVSERVTTSDLVRRWPRVTDRLAEAKSVLFRRSRRRRTQNLAFRRAGMDRLICNLAVTSS